MVKQVILTIPIQEFETIIRDCVRSELKNNKGEPPKAETDFICAKEAAAMLKISKPTLAKFTRNSLLKVYRIGRTIRYKKNEIKKAVEPIRVIKHSRLQVG
jgi:excisionase family DNA binding protein